MEHIEQKITAAVEAIRKQITSPPTIAITLGTGMGELVERLQQKVSLPYSRIPGFPSSGAENKQEQLVLGQWSGQSVIIMPKRFHYYEGFTSQQIAFPVRVFKRLGVQTLIMCNCAGGLNPLFRPGDLMVVVDHINLMGMSPLLGPNSEEIGPRFPDMKDAYDPRLISLTEQIALEEKIWLQKGVYVAVLGPHLETPAETRFLRATGADAIGMSTVPEVILGVHAGLKILVLSIIGNVNLPDAFQPIDYQKIVEVASQTESKLISLVEKIVGRLGNVNEEGKN